MNEPHKIKRATWVLIGLIVLLMATDVSAAIDSEGMLDDVVKKFEQNATQWAVVIQDAATFLYWTLVTISMIWTFGFMALRQADLGEFFAEFMRFIIFTGFFWWLLENGPDFAISIIESMKQLGASASSATIYGASYTPSSIVDIGFVVFGKSLDEGSWLSPFTWLVGILAAFGVLFICALIAINMLMLLITAWILAYGGIFILGFGGSRWTSDIAINYYKNILGIAIQLLVMILLIGIGWSIIDETYKQMDEGISLADSGTLLIIVLVIYMLANKVPALFSSVITGAPIQSPVGQFGGMAAVGAAAAAVGYAAGAVTGTMGAVSALKERFFGGGSDEDGGNDSTEAGGGADFGGGNLSGADDSSSEPSTGNTPFAGAAGYENKD